METFLLVNGYSLDFSDQEEYELVMRVATGKMEKAELAEVLRSQLIDRC